MAEIEAERESLNEERGQGELGDFQVLDDQSVGFVYESTAIAGLWYVASM